MLGSGRETGTAGRWVAGLLAAVLLAWCPPTAAEDPELARSLNQKAIEAFKADKFLDAIDFWLQATEVASEDQLVKIHKNLGLALKGVERLAEAWYHLTVYLQRADQTDVDVAQAIRTMEDTLKKVHVKVRIETEPPGATVVFPPGDRMHRVKSPLSWWLPPGEYTLEVVKDGYLDKKEKIRVGTGEQDSYRFELAVKPTTGVLNVTGAIPGSSVRVDGKSMGPLPVRTDLGPGSHRVEVFWEGGGVWKGDAVVSLGKATELKAVKPAAGIVSGETGEGGKKRRPWWPWLMVGAGGAGLVGGGATHIVAFQRNQNLAGNTQEEIDDDFNKKVKPLETAAYALYGVGGALVVGGVVALLATGGSDNADKGTPVSFVPVIGPGEVGASFGFSF